MLVGCHVCGLLNRLPPGASLPARCTRCEAQLQWRKPSSLTRSWAYLLAAAILYLPANLYPVLENTTLEGTEGHTILGGILELWGDGSPLLAAVVFMASVLVPILKILSLTLLLVCIQLRTRWRLRERAELYRLIEQIGRWSMLDVYVVALLVTLVRLQSVATVDAAPGALAFGAVVVLTMLATQAFDPRLMWDAAGENGTVPLEAWARG